MRWNEGQERAIDTCWLDEERTKRCNLLVNAAAGSGKTAVLVERIIRKILPDQHGRCVDIDSLLVVTFTKAAAAEMQQKINRAIVRNMHECKDDAVMYKKLKHQLKLLPSADISNIDSYCLRMVRNHFHLLGIDPGFSPATGPQAQMLKEQGLIELFDELYEEETEFAKEFIVLAQKYSDNYADTLLMDLIDEIYKHITSLPNPYEWLDEKIKEFIAVDVADGPWKQILCPPIDDTQIIKRTISTMRMIIVNMIAITFNIPLANAGEIFEDILKTPEKMTIYWGKAWDSLANDYTSLCNLIDDPKASFKFTNFPTTTDKLKGVDLENVPIDNFEDVFQSIRSMRDIAKGTYNSGTAYTFDEKYENTKKESLCHDLEIICKLTKRYIEKMAQIKDDNAVLEFHDIERLAYRLLTEHEDVRQMFAGRYSEVLIDEYQDINALQEAIFDALSDGSNRFMVGDMKQSIYRFRNADPTIFKHKLDTYTDDENQVVALNRNYRSRANVLDSINEVFENVMSESVGEINYDDNQRLYAGDTAYDEINSDVGGANLSEVYIISKQDKESLTSMQKEAAFVAHKIAQLKEQGFKVRTTNTDGTFSYRPLKNSDVAVLRRSVKAIAHIYEDELSKYDIDCYVETTGYFSRKEVQIIMSLIKTIDNPLCDIPLIAIMRSHIFCFTDMELAQIRLLCEDEYYMCVEAMAKMGGELGEKCSRFIDDITRWREYSKYMSSDKLIWTLYEETDFYSIVALWNDGEEAQANLRLLFERAREYENTGFKGLFYFIRFMDKIAKKENEDLSSAKQISDSHDVVKIMTMHKSKGLEFPVVFLGGMLQPLSKPSDSRIALHKDAGFGMKYIDEMYRSIDSTLCYDAIDHINKIETLSESMRLLYVAMTRAKEKLIVVGVQPKKSGDIFKQEAKWDLMYYGDANENAPEAANATTFLDWIAPIARRSNLWLYHTLPFDEHSIEETQKLQIDNEVIFDDVNSLEKDYEYAWCTRVPSKITVTELKKLAGRMQVEYGEDVELFSEYQPKSDLIVKPKFLSDKNLTAAQIGTATHFVMQTLPDDRQMTDEYIKNHINSLVEQGKLSHEEGESVSTSKIASFYKTELGKRVVASSMVYKECPFEILAKAKEIYSDVAPQCSEEEIMVQGMVDCYFEEDDEIVLLDYKTDRYTKNNIDDIREKYRLQLDWYARAVEEITKKKVKEKYLYLFSGDDVVQC